MLPAKIIRAPAFAIAVVLSIVLIRCNKCNAQADVQDVENPSLSDGIFTKPNLTTYFPSITPNPTIPFSPNAALPSVEDPMIIFEVNKGCTIYRDMYCFETTYEHVDEAKNMSRDEIEKELMGGLGLSYRPVVSAAIEYFNATNSTEGWNELTGYTVTEESDKFEVRALALGVIIKAISNIDSFHGTFDATMKLYFYNITTERTFTTMEQAMRTLYKDTSRTTWKDSTYFRLHDNELPDAWSGSKIADNEVVHPDGICSAQAMENMKPIKTDDFRLEDMIRLPQLNERMWPTVVEDSEGHVSWIEVPAMTFKYKPTNRHFFPVQTDLLDIFFEMGTTHLINEDQHIVKHLLCLHPAFSGFATHTFGSDIDAGHTTSDTLAMVPYLFYDRTEPFYLKGLPQFYYGEERQRSLIGNGSELTRMLGLRIIVEHSIAKGWFALFPVLLISLSAVAMLVSAVPTKIGGTSMVQVLLGVNSLVSLDNQYLGAKTVFGQSLLLAYGINGLWILTVVLMILINHAKEGDESGGKKWYIWYQLKIYWYLLLATASLCLLYIPLITAYHIDKSNGNQTRVKWVWGFVLSIIALVFFVRVVLDRRKCNQDEEKRDAETVKEFSDIYKFSSKPLHLWDQVEVLRWVSIGSMHRAAYFSEVKRSSISDKFSAACVDGELLCQFGTDVDKLVQFVNLPFGDAVKLAEEVKLLLENNSESDALHISSALVVVKN